jgi:transposase
MLCKGEEYTDQGQACCEERYRQPVLHNLNWRAQQLGMTLVPTPPPPPAQAA